MQKKTKKQKHKEFTPLLLEWFKNSNRPLPWKGEKNPYYIWLSEIILQQTRVEQGLPYFNRFKAKYPSIHDLANASEDEVMKLWEGLGYYSRARNLHFTAKYISNNLNGVFPKTHADILKLKGVGAYTAAAIASFAYELPYAVVDGNVYRVLSRYFGIKTPIDTTQGKKDFAKLAQDLLDKTQAGKYNQAIMDFGATHCTPKLAKCKTCPLNINCIAYGDELVTNLPIKSKKITKKERFFNYFIFKNANFVFVKKRTTKDIWQNLYHFPLIEVDKLITQKVVEKTDLWQEWKTKGIQKVIKQSKPYKQTLTHQKIVATFWEIETTTDFNLEDYTKYPYQELNKLAFPKIIDCYLKDKSLYLDLK